MRWHHYQSEIASLVLLGGLTAAAFAGCSQNAAPPPPSPTNSAETEKTSGTSGDTDDLGSDDKINDTDDGPSGGMTFNFGGADIGEDDDKENVKKCHEEGHVYDRFGEDGGECSDLPLAQMDCTLDGIRAVLSEAQKKTFNSKMKGDYADWEIDQCGDCPEDSDHPLCESTEGKKQVGTKVFFVQEDGESIRGRALILPVRPDGSQGSAGGGSSAGSGSSSEDEEEAEEEDPFSLR